MKKQNYLINYRIIYAFFLTMLLAESFGQLHLYILKAEVNAFLMSKGM